jgi:hypothetical protein
MFLHEYLQNITFDHKKILFKTNKAEYAFSYEPRNALVIRDFYPCVPGEITHFTFIEDALVLEIEHEPAIYLEWRGDIKLIRKIIDEVPHYV